MDRQKSIQNIENLLQDSPIVAILGPRQCGKTTLAKQIAKLWQGPTHHFDLEDSADLTALHNPKWVFESLTGLIIIDEIQRLPDLFPTLRVLVDQDSAKKFLILGSASKLLIRQSSETLAGRISYLELSPFHLAEGLELKTLWERGGFPRSYLASSDSASWNWRKNYINTFLEQDIPNLGFNIPSAQMLRFWMMLAHYHGQTLNVAELAQSLSLSQITIRKYLDILVGTFMVRLLQPWTANVKKRLVKSPKFYITDSGIFHHLLSIQTMSELISHPKLGASWEGFALQQVIQKLELDQNSCFFWATHNKAELDLLTFQHGKKIGYEFKFTDSPKITPSMKHAIDDLELDKLVIIFPSNKQFQMSEKIHAKGLGVFCL